MEVTDVRVALRQESDTRLKAYATVTFDHCFVVRNLKIIEGKNGLFVAMPSRKPKVACEACHYRSDWGARFCAQCGRSLNPAAHGAQPEQVETQAHRDMAHPITAEFRETLQRCVLKAYEAERTKGGGPPSGQGESGAL